MIFFHALPVQEQRCLDVRLNGITVPGGVFANFTSASVIDGKLIVHVLPEHLPADLTLVNGSGGALDYVAVAPHDVTAMVEILKVG